MYKIVLAAGVAALWFASAQVGFSQVKRSPQVVYLGKSTVGGYFAVVDAGTTSGFDAESEVCLFDAKDRLVLCTQVIVAKRRAAALALTRKQYDKTIPSMTVRLSANNAKEITSNAGSSSANDDRLELAPSHFFRDGRSAAEISRIERALSRVEPKENLKEAPQNTLNDSNASGSTSDVTVSEYKIVPATPKPKAESSKRFRVGYNYHVVMPVKFNHLKLREVTSTGDLKWSNARMQTSAPIGFDLAFQFPSKNRAIVVRGLAAGTAAEKGKSNYNVAKLAERESSTTTASLFYGIAVGGAWSVIKEDSWVLWLGSGLGLVRSVVDVSVEAGSDGTEKEKVAMGRSTLTIIMPEVSSYIEWTQGYAAAYLGLQAGVPWLAGSRKLDATDTSKGLNTDTDRAKKAENYKNMLDSLEHDPSRFSLAAFVAGSVLF